MSLSRREFVQELDRFINDVRARALEHFDQGVPPPRALRLAIQMATALAMHRAKAQLKMALERAPTPGTRD